MAMPLTVYLQRYIPEAPPCLLSGCLHLASRATVAVLRSRLCYAATFPLFTRRRRCLGQRTQFTEWHLWPLYKNSF